MPTTCLNKLIEDYNRGENGGSGGKKKLKKLTREKLLAKIFNKLEEILDKIDEEDDIKYAENLYYKYWLHGYVT